MKLRSGDLHTVHGETMQEVINKVQSFRQDADLDIGDPNREVNDYLCKLWPHLCRQEDTVEADESAENKTLRQRSSNWKFNRYAQSHENKDLVEPEIAEGRAKICATCPKNQSNRDGCTPCVVDNDRVFFMLRQGQSTETKVGGCEVTGQDNETAAFFTKPMLAYAKKYKDELPSHCWLLKEI